MIAHVCLFGEVAEELLKMDPAPNPAPTASKFPGAKTEFPAPRFILAPFVAPDFFQVEAARRQNILYGAKSGAKHGAKIPGANTLAPLGFWGPWRSGRGPGEPVGTPY